MSKKLLTGVILGAAAGAVLGMLFAPETGSEMRKKIAKKGSDLGDTVRTKFNDLGEALQEKYNTVRGDANDIIEKGKASMHDIKNDVKEKATDFKAGADHNFS